MNGNEILELIQDIAQNKAKLFEELDKLKQHTSMAELLLTRINKGIDDVVGKWTTLISTLKDININD